MAFFGDHESNYVQLHLLYLVMFTNIGNNKVIKMKQRTVSDILFFGRNHLAGLFQVDTIMRDRYTRQCRATLIRFSNGAKIYSLRKH